MWWHLRLRAALQSRCFVIRGFRPLQLRGALLHDLVVVVVVVVVVVAAAAAVVVAVELLAVPILPRA